MIKKNQVEYAAKLARIKLTAEEKESLQKDLSNILDYIEKLQKLNTDNVELISHSTSVKNITKKDVVKVSPERQEIINLFPKKEKKFLKVNPIKNTFS